jgi:hypothetical protein
MQKTTREPGNDEISGTIAKEGEAFDLVAKIGRTIHQIERVEKITKRLLSEVSRDMLSYFVAGGADTNQLNQLIGVLTPRNQSAAIKFFKALLPWNYDEEQGRFTNMKGKKQVEKVLGETKVLLADPTFDIWSWAHDNLRDQIVKPGFDMVVDTVKRVQTEGKNGREAIGPAEIIAAVVEAGITVDQVMEALAESDSVPATGTDG